MMIGPLIFVSALIQLLGLLAAALLLYSFWQTTSGKLEPASARNSWLNLLGSIGLAISCAWQLALGGFLLNVCWVIISASNLRKTKMSKQTGST